VLNVFGRITVVINEVLKLNVKLATCHHLSRSGYSDISLLSLVLSTVIHNGGNGFLCVIKKKYQESVFN